MPETISGACAELRRLRQDLLSPSAGYVLFGAGRVGRLTLRALTAAGSPPLVIADNDCRLWGKALDGVSVLPPADALRLYPAATVILAIQEPTASRSALRQLSDMGVQRHMIGGWAWTAEPCNAADAESLSAVWADDWSRRECAAQLALRLGVDARPPSDLAADIYFPRDLFRLHDSEVFVDLGAYDGDTFLEFRQRVRDFTAYVAFEPDPRNFGRLRAHMANYPADSSKIHIWNTAVSEEPGFVWFRATADVSSRICDHGESKVPCERLDNLSWPESPTFIKMDIEGSELAALKSGEKLIREHRPILAVCAYHKPQDLWEIPLWIAGLGVGYRVYLRRYGPADTELVVYGVPGWR